MFLPNYLVLNLIINPMDNNLIFYILLSVYAFVIHRFTDLRWVSVKTVFSIDQFPAQMLCIQSTYGNVDPSFDLESKKIISKLNVLMFLRLKFRIGLFSLILLAVMCFQYSFIKISIIAISTSLIIFIFYTGSLMYYQRKLLTRASDYDHKMKFHPDIPPT